MKGINRLPIAFMVIGFALASVPGWRGQAQTETAPVPAPIVYGKKAFISNAGGGCSPLGSVGRVGFSGGPNRAYNQFTAALKGWGRYELVSAPADADLAFEISLPCPAAGVSVLKGDSMGPIYDPQLRLGIVDVKTRITLWVITEHVQFAFRPANLDKNFDEAMSKLMDDLKRLVAGTSQ